jgi:hypothetical protein
MAREIDRDGQKTPASEGGRYKDTPAVRICA